MQVQVPAGPQFLFLSPLPYVCPSVHCVLHAVSVQPVKSDIASIPYHDANNSLWRTLLMDYSSIHTESVQCHGKLPESSMQPTAGCPDRPVY